LFVDKMSFIRINYDELYFILAVLDHVEIER